MKSEKDEQSSLDYYNQTEARRYASLKDYPDNPIPKLVTWMGITMINKKWKDALFIEGVFVGKGPKVNINEK